MRPTPPTGFAMHPPDPTCLPCDRAGLWESDGVHGFVDPEPIIQERLTQELQALRDELAQAITWRHRRRIRRRIRQSEARIRRDFSSAQW